MEEEALLNAKKEALQSLIDKIDTLKSQISQKMATVPQDYSRNQKLDQKFKLLLAEREHLLYQLRELENGLIFDDANTRNGVIQPSDSKHIFDEIQLPKVDEKTDFLSLTGFNILTVLQDINPFKNLKSLCLSRCNLWEIPLTAFQLKQLEKLDISRNKISVISPQISTLTNLKFLSLSRNLLEALPYGWTNGFIKLETLNLSHNKLASAAFEGEMQECVKLTLISLAFNHLDCIPLAILVNCKSLKRLYLNNNQITEVPSEIESLTSLEYVMLDYNLLTHVNPLAKLSTLSGLCISHNRVEKEPIFKSQLKIFSVDGNPYITERTR